MLQELLAKKKRLAEENRARQAGRVIDAKPVDKVEQG
jgi:hypothetical protein